MGNSESGPGAADTSTLLKRKIALARDMLRVTGRELLLVDMDGLQPLLEQKEELIAQMRAVDAALAGREVSGAAAQALLAEFAAVVRSVLENEEVFEARLRQEQERLRAEMREFEQQTRLRSYLDATRPKGGALDLKK